MEGAFERRCRPPVNRCSFVGAYTTGMSAQTPRFLILETSGRVGQVALAQGDQVLGVRRLDEARRHARDLAPAVSELLKEQGWNPRDVGGVVVDLGPGSYTGLRVGIMSAMAFAYATGGPVFGVGAFPAIALQVPEEVRRADVIADAQQGKVYVQRFMRQAATPLWIAESELRIEVAARWLEGLPADVCVTGPGLSVYRGRLRPEVSRVDAVAWEPRPQSLLQLALPRFHRSESDDLWRLEPLYGRPSSAEEKWQSPAR
jgi:tRNA threonylcarbamoyladenosine biosynthesis protein TsaB